MNILTNTSNSTVFIAAAAILAAVLITILIIKQFFKLVILLIIFILIYASYLFLTGQKLPENSKEMIDQGTKQIEMLKEKGSRFIPVKSAAE